MPHSILVVEDNPDLAGLLALHLRDAGHEVDLAGDGVSALSRSRDRAYDLVILDIMLPRLDGLEVCRRLRSASRYVPILMLTARSAEIDRVLGLEIGADDYVTKPFSLHELLARVKAIFRRVESLTMQPHGESIRHQGLTLDMASRQVSVDGHGVELTAKEFDLLRHFAAHPGRVFTRAQLLDAVWGYGHDGYEHTVNSHINRLRAKIEADPTTPRYVLTVWGVGYKFAERTAPGAADSGEQEHAVPSPARPVR